ncbi:hypothetical protein [Eubacterium aggregans]|uniref:hypothetical protein n=1 Tax=Eubacterium aggregans TaxID=81409 RepID=UPI003F2A4D72
MGRDITASKIAEKRYLDEVAYTQATQSANLLAKVRSNLTQDYVESYSAQEGIAVGTVGTSYTDCAEALAQTAFTPEERAEVRKALRSKAGSSGL